MPHTERSHPIVLFDGNCSFCSAIVRFVIARDPKGLYRFAPLMSNRGRLLLHQCGLLEDADQTYSDTTLKNGDDLDGFPTETLDGMSTRASDDSLTEELDGMAVEVSEASDSTSTEKLNFISVGTFDSRASLKNNVSSSRKTEAGHMDTFVLIEGERCFTRSTAALRLCLGLKGLWPLLYIFIVVPRPLRDAIYDFVSRHRYRLIARDTTCEIFSPEIRERFLE